MPASANQHVKPFDAVLYATLFFDSKHHSSIVELAKHKFIWHSTWSLPTSICKKWPTLWIISFWPSTVLMIFILLSSILKSKSEFYLQKKMYLLQESCGVLKKKHRSKCNISSLSFIDLNLNCNAHILSNRRALASKLLRRIIKYVRMVIKKMTRQAQFTNINKNPRNEAFILLLICNPNSNLLDFPRNIRLWLLNIPSLRLGKRTPMLRCGGVSCMACPMIRCAIFPDNGQESHKRIKRNT